MTTDGGGWTVIQDRRDGSVDFYRGWADYKAGFGKLDGEHWLGNDRINGLASPNSGAQLYVKMKRNNGDTAYAKYGSFSLDTEANKYKLTASDFTGTSGDSLTYHSNRPFTTKDKDNDEWGGGCCEDQGTGNCAVAFLGAWWYGACHTSNLNGHYGDTNYADGLDWAAITNRYESLKETRMMTRRSKPIPGGLVAEWRFDNDWSDATGLWHTATPVNGATLGAGKVCAGVKFDGMDDHVELPTMPAALGTTGLTLAAWVKFERGASGSAYERVFDIGNGQANNNILFARQSTGGNLYFEVLNGSSSCGHIIASNVIDSNLHHYVATLDANKNAKIYRDGVQVAAGTFTCLPAGVSRTKSYIGKSNWSGETPFQGQIDEAKIWNTGFTAAQVAAIYANENAGKNWDGTARNCPAPAKRDCRAWLADDVASLKGKDGLYWIHANSTATQAWCDMTTDGGGWTVFQDRRDGSVDFYRGWADYKAGFGKLDGEHWLGNERIHGLTQDGGELYVKLKRVNGQEAYAQYSTFKIANEAANYTLTATGYTGTAGDSITTEHNGKGFTTKDRDNDVWGNNCANEYYGAWWYGSCHYSNLNGHYGDTNYADGPVWYHFAGYYDPMKETRMMVRTGGAPRETCTATAMSCRALLNADSTLKGKDGVYWIDPDGSGGAAPFQAYCDMTTDGGGWTVFQNRRDGSEDFYRGWADYKAGFGSVTGEHWMGNDRVSVLTQYGAELYVKLKRANGQEAYARYSTFKIADEANKYTLTATGYSGTAGDSITTEHNGKGFTTKDRDNDVWGNNCANEYYGAWWYGSCHYSNLNGHYGDTNYADGPVWYHLAGYHEPMKETRMMVREASSLPICSAPVPVAEWRMDEPSWSGAAGEVKDSGTGGYHGTAVKGAATGEAKVCRGGSFDGADVRHVTLPTAFQDVAQNSFTMSLWVKPGKTHEIDPQHNGDCGSAGSCGGVSGQNYALFPSFDSSKHGWEGNNYSAAGLSVGTNGISVYEHSGSYMPAVLVWEGSVSASEWTHVTVAYRDGTPSLYVNGEFRKTGVKTGKSTVVATHFIGSPVYGNYKGGVDEYKVFPGSLTSGQIAAIHANESAGKNHDGTTRTCPLTGPDHYELSVPTTGVSCLGYEIKVTACKNADCSTKYTEAANTQATLSASHGQLGATGVAFDANGEARTTLSFPDAANGATTTIKLDGAQVKAQKPAKCCPDGTACAERDNCTLTFSTAGLIFTKSAGGNSESPATQISGKTSEQLYLRAVQANTTTKKCEAVVSGNRAVGLAYTCNTPATCSSGNWMTVGGTSFGSGGTTNVTLNFDATTGAAPFTLKFNDAGKIQMTAAVTTNNGAVLRGAMLTPFLVKPAGLCVYSTDTSTCSAADATCPKAKTAGAPFNLTVTAVRTEDGTNPACGSPDATRTPNFQMSGIAMESALVAPAGGANGLVGVKTLDITANGWNSVNQSISEVGVFKFSATAPQYLGETIGTSGKFETGAMGRFTPAKLTTTWNAPTLGHACGSSFSYLDQPFGFGTAPEFTITATNLAGALTQNYTGAFWKLVAPSSLPGYNHENASDPATGDSVTFVSGVGFSNLQAGTFAYASKVNGVGKLKTDGARFAYTRPTAPGVQTPFTPQISLSVPRAVFCDAEADCAQTGGAMPTTGVQISGIAGASLRQGRVQMLDLVGRETMDIKMAVGIQYYVNATQQWRTNNQDTCTVIRPSDFAFDFPNPDTNHLTACETKMTTVDNKLYLTKPGSGNDGTIDLTLNLGNTATGQTCTSIQSGFTGSATAAGSPWLQIGTTDPKAKAKFTVRSVTIPRQRY